MSFTYKALYSKSLTAKRKIFSDGFVRVSNRGNSNTYVTLYAASSSGNSPTGEALDSGYVSTRMLGEEFIIERFIVTLVNDVVPQKGSDMQAERQPKQTGKKKNKNKFRVPRRIDASAPSEFSTKGEAPKTCARQPTSLHAFQPPQKQQRVSDLHERRQDDDAQVLACHGRVNAKRQNQRSNDQHCTNPLQGLSCSHGSSIQQHWLLGDLSKYDDKWTVPGSMSEWLEHDESKQKRHSVQYREVSEILEWFT